jgi:hypothetical protein
MTAMQKQAQNPDRTRETAQSTKPIDHKKTEDEIPFLSLFLFLSLSSISERDTHESSKSTPYASGRAIILHCGTRTEKNRAISENRLSARTFKILPITKVLTFSNHLANKAIAIFFTEGSGMTGTTGVMRDNSENGGTEVRDTAQ